MNDIIKEKKRKEREKERKEMEKNNKKNQWSGCGPYRRKTIIIKQTDRQKDEIDDVE